MRISELSRHSGVPVSTIKFYIREGLLPSGVRSQRNQASYDEAHLRRLDLIRSLQEAGGLALDTVRDDNRIRFDAKNAPNAPTANVVMATISDTTTSISIMVTFVPKALKK